MPIQDLEPLLQLAQQLRNAGYVFNTVTPETHRRVVAREPDRRASSLRDVFGWNLRFEPALLPAPMLDGLRQAGMLEEDASGFRSKVRFATLAGGIYMHSAYPTHEADAVFFGPDTYRFANLIAQELSPDNFSLRRVLDVGCGSGAGGLHAAHALINAGRSKPSLELVDINPNAIAFARINAAANGLDEVQFRRADLYAGTQPGVDLIVANPPYLVDDSERLYRHGGGRWGFDLSLRIVAEGLPLLSGHGALVLYTGVPIMDGRDPFFEAVQKRLTTEGFASSYRELDPDVFGEELEAPAYREVERIAAVALVVRRGRNSKSTGIAGV